MGSRAGIRRSDENKCHESISCKYDAAGKDFVEASGDRAVRKSQR
jgi:hypothetical protein